MDLGSSWSDEESFLKESVSAGDYSKTAQKIFKTCNSREHSMAQLCYESVERSQQNHKTQGIHFTKKWIDRTNRNPMYGLAKHINPRQLNSQNQQSSLCSWE